MRKKRFLALAAMMSVSVMLATAAAAAAVPARGSMSDDRGGGCRSGFPGSRFGVQRYVIQGDSAGKSFTEFSGCVRATGVLPGGDQYGTLWTTDEMPVDNHGTTDAALESPGVLPPANGSRFGFIYRPGGMPQRPHQRLHRIDTTEEWVIVTGEATLETNKDLIHLKPGDTVIIRGAEHALVHDLTSRPFLAVTTTLDASPPASGAASDKAGTTLVSSVTCPAGSLPRYVVGNDAEGLSYTQYSGCKASGPIPFPGGDRSGILWSTSQMPVDNSGTNDAGSGPGGPIGPGHSNGHSTGFGFIYHAANQAPSNQFTPHKTNTIDYWIVLQGSVTVNTNKDSIQLKAGDTLVVRGANHAWIHADPSPVPYVAVTFTLDALPNP